MVCGWCSRCYCNSCFISCICVSTQPSRNLSRRSITSARDILDQLSGDTCQWTRPDGSNRSNHRTPIGCSRGLRSKNQTREFLPLLSSRYNPDRSCGGTDLLVIPRLRKRVECCRGVQESGARLPSKHTSQRPNNQRPLRIRRNCRCRKQGIRGGRQHSSLCRNALERARTLRSHRHSDTGGHHDFLVRESPHRRYVPGIFCNSRRKREFQKPE